MKTKLLFRAIQNCKNGILSFLIIFFMTASSFGQTTFKLKSDDCITTGIQTLIFQFEDPDQNNLVIGQVLDSFENVVQGGWQMLAEAADPQSATNNFDRWEIQDPGGTRWFFTEETPDKSLPEDPCNATWLNASDPPEQGLCGNVESVMCTGGPTEEICDGMDNDGDGEIDEGLDFTTYYKDNDGDGFGDENISISTCDGAPAGYVANSLDCYDEDGINYDDDPTVYPGAPEICDGLDNNCDGQIDEGIDGCIDGVIVDYCDDQNKKILICHNGKTKCVSINAMDAHLAHGDYLGTCGSSKEGDADIAEEVPTSYDVVSWPNPTRDSFNIRMSTPNTTDKVSFEAFDINGRLIHSNIINGNEDYQFGSQLSSGIYFVRLSQANTIKVIKVIKQ